MSRMGMALTLWMSWMTFIFHKFECPHSFFHTLTRPTVFCVSQGKLDEAEDLAKKALQVWTMCSPVNPLIHI